jgi:DNA-binding transcriptional ArsR family regulator
MTNKNNMSVQTIWNIRDARALTTMEKVFLYTLASRGKTYSTRKTIQEDTGLSDGSVSKVVRSLQEKGLIDVVRRNGTTTIYTINEDILSIWVSYYSCGEAGVSSDEARVSSPEDGGLISRAGGLTR